MRRADYDRLRTVRVEYESRNGRAELCREPDGTRWVKLRIQSPACQRECLDALDRSVPARLENGVLELLLPWHEGVPPRQWLYERTPTLGQRRDACLSLLEQQVELRGRLPPCLTALSARADNLIVQGETIALQYLPELRRWEPGMGEAEAVCAVAAVICGLLLPEQGKWFRQRLPEELQLLYLRQKEGDYTSWGSLQRDVAAIPDDLPPIQPAWRPYAGRVRRWLARYGTYILRVLAAVLLAAALLSLWWAYRGWKDGSEPVWQGMPQVGDQDLRSGEGGE